jgi:hypothetical protein
MIRACGAASLLVALTLAGCGSSSSDPTTAASVPAAAKTTPVQSAKATYAKAQAAAIDRIDYAVGEVLYLNAAATGPAVLGQKLHSLSAAARKQAETITKLRPPADAASLQRREVARLRKYARTLDAWVRAHPKRTVGDANDIVHRGRDALEPIIDGLHAKGAIT